MAIEGLGSSGQAATLATFTRSRLTRVSLADSRLSRLDLTEVGLDLSGALLRNIVFEHCNGSFAHFRGATLKSVRLQGCILTGSSSQEADLREVVFQDCELGEAQLSLRG